MQQYSFMDITFGKPLVSSTKKDLHHPIRDESLLK
jgi:hypothetical protein